MTEKRPTPDGSAGKGRRKRAAPTIDLKATEVQPAAAADEPPARDAVQEPAQASAHEPAPTPEKEQAAHAQSESLHTKAEPPQAEAAEPAPGAQRSAAIASQPIGLIVAAGVAGAAVMSVVAVVLWFSGLLPADDKASSAANTRVTALETKLQELQKRPAPSADTQAVDALTQRVAKLEDGIKNIPSSPQTDPALLRRVDAADNAMKSLGLALTALNRRSDDIAANAKQAQENAATAEKAAADLRAGLQDVSKTASAGASSADLAPLQQRIAALEQSAKAAQAGLAAAQAQIAKASASDKAARLALSATALRDAVLRGAPFADELAQAKSLGGDDKSLAPLASFAAAGVPSDRVLARELSALLPAMNKAAGAPKPSGGFIERLQANAGQLVRVRPLDAPAGDDSAAVLARLESEAAKADIAAALADVGKLPEPARQVAADWVTRASQRQQALAAVRQFAADAAHSLGPR